MAFGVPKLATAFQVVPVGKGSKRQPDKPYLEWLHELPCIVTGEYGVQAAHISYDEPRFGKVGRGLGRKESDCWAVPLSPDEHRRQHGMNEREYWRQVGINPVLIALSLYAAYPNTERAMLIIRSAKTSSEAPNA